MSEKHWREYDYNDVVGWVSLLPRNNAIRAEYWFIRQRPTKVLVRKEFENKGKLFQVKTKGLSDLQIYSKLLAGFHQFQNNSYMSKYHFDLQSFKSVGKYIHWASILNEVSA